MIRESALVASLQRPRSRHMVTGSKIRVGAERHRKKVEDQSLFVLTPQGRTRIC